MSVRPPDSELLADLLADRHSCRAFLPGTVPESTIRTMFQIAQRTPSWCNTQPWQAHLTTGAETIVLADALATHVSTSPEYSDLPAPSEYRGVYGDRRRESGHALYRSLGIDRSDSVRRREQLMENFRFFGAPHTAVITTDRSIGVYGAIDCGAYILALLLAAQSLGLGAIPQAAIAMYSDFIRDYLALPEDRLVVCAVSFGYADTHHPANAFRTPRADVDDVLRDVGRPDRVPERTR